MADPRVDPTWLKATSAREGFFQDFLERAYRLAILLGEIGGNSYLAAKLALKGGTAINFFHADLPRLSVDADFNYVGQIDREAMMAEKAEVLAALQETGRSLGYEIDVIMDEHAEWSVRLLYENSHQSRDAVRLEVNFLERIPLYGIEMRVLPNLFELQREKVPVLSLEEVYGGKLRALVVRAAPRDVFDAAHFFSNKTKHDPEKLRKAFLFLASMDDATLQTVNLTGVEKLGDQEYRDNLAPLLRRGLKISAKALNDAVLPHLRNMLELSPDEAKFGQLLEAQSYEPSLLFGKVKVSARIAAHPAAEWRRRDPHGRLKGGP